MSSFNYCNDDKYSYNRYIIKEYYGINTCVKCKKKLFDNDIICGRCKAGCKDFGKKVGKGICIAGGIISVPVALKPMLKK